MAEQTVQEGRLLEAEEAEKMNRILNKVFPNSVNIKDSIYSVSHHRGRIVKKFEFDKERVCSSYLLVTYQEPVDDDIGSLEDVMDEIREGLVEQGHIVKQEIRNYPLSFGAFSYIGGIFK